MHNLALWRSKIDHYFQLNKNKFKDKKVLDIGLGDSASILGQFDCELSILDKMKHPKRTDILAGDLLNIDTLGDYQGQFDIVCCCEVLEHVEDPFLAVKNLKTLVKPKGLIYVTVPCFLPWHPGGHHYGDYFRYMPSSIKLLFSGMPVLETPYDSDIENMPLGICAEIFA